MRRGASAVDGMGARQVRASAPAAPRILRTLRPECSRGDRSLGAARCGYLRRGFFFAGPFASRSARSSIARSIVSDSAASDFGTVAFVLPSET